MGESMNRKILVSFLIVLMVVVLTGCDKSRFPSMGEDAQTFLLGEYIDHNDDDQVYGTIDYNGRTYIDYGIVNNIMKDSEVEKCIGYIVQTNSSSEDETATRVYTLYDDKNLNYLMVYYGDNSNIIEFYRAMDTKGKEIKTPDYIKYKEENKYWTDKSDNETHVFYGKIIEVTGNIIIVEPDQDSNERRSSDKISIDVTKNDYQIGTRVKVTYSGGIEEMYPAKVRNATVEVDY